MHRANLGPLSRTPSRVLQGGHLAIGSVPAVWTKDRYLWISSHEPQITRSSPELDTNHAPAPFRCWIHWPSKTPALRSVPYAVLVGASGPLLRRQGDVVLSWNPWSISCNLSLEATWASWSVTSGPLVHHDLKWILYTSEATTRQITKVHEIVGVESV